MHIPSILTYSEPVSASCDWIASAAPFSCRESNGSRCDWYHGTWQYLRLLDLVSNPTWHTDFFVPGIAARQTTRDSVRVLVSGSADYSMYAQAHAAVGPRLDADVLDWCPTPLAASAWLARYRSAAAPRLICGDAVQHGPADEYDVIVSDSFLPRFPAEQLPLLLKAWRGSLRDGGAVLTTVRIHDQASGGESARPGNVERWRAAAERSARWWPGVSSLPVAELVERAGEFAARQERNAVYRRSDLMDLFDNAGFRQVQCDVVDVAGKQFARVTAS